MRAYVRRPLVVAAVTAATVAVVAGTAVAYWRTAGSGAGQASVANAAAVTITTNGTPATLLRPGSTGDLVVSISNPNPFSVQVVAVTGNGTPTASGGTGPCTTTGVSVAVPGADLPITVPANASSTRFVLAGALAMSTASESGCQNASFTVPLAVTVRR